MPEVREHHYFPLPLSFIPPMSEPDIYTIKLTGYPEDHYVLWRDYEKLKAEVGQIHASSFMHENAELKKWKEGAVHLLENYYKLIVDKDDRFFKMEQEFKSAKAEINRLKSIEVTNKPNV